MDDIVELVRQIGHQQGQNTYYRICYSLLKELQEHIQNSLGRLAKKRSRRLMPNQDMDTAAAIAIGLRSAAISIRMRQERARIDWKDFF
jgi:histone H3/H4